MVANDVQYCMALVDSKQYASGYGLDEIWMLTGIEFLKELKQIATDFLNNSTVKRPLFQHYAAHAESLTAIFEAMKVHWHIRSTPSSAVFFEFIDLINDKNKTQVNSIVKALYHDGNTNSFQYLKLKNGKDNMTLAEFLQYMNDNLSSIPFTSAKEMCQNTTIEVPKPSDYYSSALVLKDFYAKYFLIAKGYLFLE